MTTIPAVSRHHTWKPTTGGILSIISGTINLFTGIGLVTVTGYEIWAYPYTSRDYMGFEYVGLAAGAILIVLAFVAILGGVFALMRRTWGMALTGAICSVLPIVAIVFGIPSLIFIAMSKDEF